MDLECLEVVGFTQLATLMKGQCFLIWLNRKHGEVPWGQFGGRAWNIMFTGQLTVPFVSKWVFSMVPGPRSPPVKGLLAQLPFWTSRLITHDWRMGQVCCLFLPLVLWPGHRLLDLWIHSSVPNPVCPNQRVTVIFGFVPIRPANVVSHILLPISALNRQSLWWSQACFRIPWEPQCQVVTTLELEMEKAVIWGWLAPSLWVIMETLSPDAAGRDWLLVSPSVRWDSDPLTS